MLKKTPPQAGFHDGEQFQAGMSTDYVEEFKRRCKEKRFTARDFKFNPESAGQSQRMEEQVRSFIIASPFLYGSASRLTDTLILQYLRCWN